MPSRARKTVATTLPDEEFAALDRVRKQRSQSRAEVVRDAIRWYVGAVRHLPVAEEPSPDEIEAIREGEEEFARGKTRRLEDVLHELER
jgi:metal-responsive CopG/Arc/MetJ family transcriptional regulator